LADSNFIRRYFVGNGVDIGGKPDPLALYAEFFPLMTGVRTWDWEDGDAQHMHGVADETFDFAFASHCLEHLHDPLEGLKNWLRVLKPGAHLIVNIPEEDLYEQGEFPSSFNRDHKSTWTVFKERSWSPKSVNVVELLRELGAQADIRKIEVIDSAYRYQLPRYDQTLSPVAESAIEFIVRKRPKAEMESGARERKAGGLSREVLLHLNQYRDDQTTLREANRTKPPFQNDKQI
jgi:SAM-dependent methyltransferase